MNPLLDTVEPTLWGHKALDTLIISNTPHAHLENVALYSRETVESLLSQYRKEVLLEAAKYIDSIQGQEIHDTMTYKICASELRRMAEGETK